ncbi:helix-turn-helix domain-containing protein [Paenibacillus alvei]|uniref:Helix-turn-helix domain-containing protein n=1 Tax=Paenibacillus alvei TaxID=44250 RepID=A0ABT4H121_PAEAL|nr:XRE family transcriptional regulator [Paenibacillus alvei]MCY9545058.1 helix-turn-helix domain-containing protein [Paenibacillus alvei]MCY9708364.1 helix-turn-helix domain-containing protein [Paenibacillus alvei]MCY9738259.1 helix-turn-helix domain-containing protein [Paenibacillus alvei]MCY9758534.1 helix-turn-helix domain-containing protein [Paenibacillus alvei]MCY9762635.1 helix-turn-helix domain-containing protein [Paenibacillus alvei]
MYGKKLQELRKIEGWTQEEVAKKLGISKQTYSHYENEKRRPSLNTIRELASVYQVNIDDIFAEEKISDLIMLPVVGKICCGEGALAYQDIEGYEPTPKDWLNGGEYFYLRAKGDSMIGARIFDGDLLLIRRQPEVENGEVAAVLIGDQAVLKRVYKNGDQLVLQSENPNYPPIFAPPSDAIVIGKLKMNVIKY